MLLKLNYVRESIYVRIRMTLSGVKMNGICPPPTSRTSTMAMKPYILSATKHINLRIPSPMVRIFYQETLEMVFFIIALIVQMKTHSRRKWVTMNLEMKLINLGQIG